MPNHIKLIIITGPIGSGKSQLAFKLRNQMDYKNPVLIDISSSLKQITNDFLSIHYTTTLDKDIPRNYWNDLSYRQILFLVSDLSKKVFGEFVFIHDFIEKIKKHMEKDRFIFITTGILNTYELETLIHLLKASISNILTIDLIHYEFSYDKNTSKKIKQIHDIRSKVISEEVAAKFPRNIIYYEKISVGDYE